MSSLFRGVTNEPVLAGRDRPKVIIKGLIRDALAELAKSPLDGETTTSLSMPLLAEILSDD